MSYDPSSEPSGSSEPSPAATQPDSPHLSGANWFFWIAGLSLVNTLILISGGDRNFIVGLGATTIIAIEAAQSEQNVGPEAVLVIKAIAIVLCAGIAGVFAGFGFFARRRHVWAFAVGIFLYLLDGLVYLALGDLLSAGFHAFVLFQLFHGCKAARALNLAPPAPIAPILATEIEPNA